MNHTVYHILAVLVALLCVPTTNVLAGRRITSDELTITNIGVAEGLSQNTVRSLAIDKRGFVWVGTDDGLNRYDGSNFIVFKPNYEGEFNQGGVTQVRDVQVDGSGLLWLQSVDMRRMCISTVNEKPLTLHDERGREIQRFRQSELCILPDSMVLLYGGCKGAILFRGEGDAEPHCLWRDSILYTAHTLGPDGSIWLGGRDLVRLSLNEDEQIDSHHYAIEGMAGRVAAVVALPDMVIVADGSAALHRIDVNSGRRLSDINLAEGLVAEDICELAHSLICIRCANGTLLIYDAAQQRFVNPSTLGADRLGSRCSQFVRDNEGQIWICDGHGSIHHFDAINRIFRPVRVMSEEKAAQYSCLRNWRPPIIISDSFEPGVYWLGSYGGGLLRYDENTETVDRITSAEAYVPENILAIRQDEVGNIWLGSEYIGIVKISPKRYVSHTLRPGLVDGFSSGNNVSVVFEGLDGNVWAGIRDGDLCIFNPNLTNLLSRKEGICPTCIVADKRGRVWVGTDGHGIYVYDLSTLSELAHYGHRADDYNSLATDRVKKLLLDTENRLWVVMADGSIDQAERYGQDRVQFRHLIEAQPQGSRNVGDAFIDFEGYVWVARQTDLLCFSTQRILKNEKDFVVYDYNLGAPDGLASDDVRAICEDRQHRIWIGTGGGGLSRLTFEVGSAKFAKFTHYSRKDGLPSNIVTALICADDTTLWVGTENGLSRFDTRRASFANLRIGETDFGNLFNDHAVWKRGNGNILWGSLDGLIDFNPCCRVKDVDPPTPVITDIWMGNLRLCAGDNTFADDVCHLDAAAPYATKLVLDQAGGDVTFSFSNLTLGHLSGRQFVYTLEGFDNTWSRPSPANTVTYRRLPAGNYRFMVRNLTGSDNEVRTLDVVVSNDRWTPLTITLMVLVVGVFICLPIVAIRTLRSRRINDLVERRVADLNDAFLQNVSRQIKAPMRMIENSCATIRDGQKRLPAEFKSHFVVIDRNAAKLSAMINAIVELRDAHEPLPLNLETTNVAPFLNDIFKSFNLVASRRKIRCSLNVPGGWRVLLDRDKVEKIVSTLVDNSFKNTPDGGEVNITAFQNQRSQCVISVIDTGRGVPPEARENLFANIIGITGNEFDLNLQMVAEYVKAHHGQIVYSANPHGGSIFTVALPTDYSRYPDANIVLETSEFASHDDDADTADDDVESYAPHTETNPDGSLTQTPNILIVDDKEPMMTFLAERLSPYYNVVMAPNVNKALSLITQQMPDLIVSDAYMQPTDGLELVRRLKKDFNYSHIPCVVISASENRIALASEDCFGPDCVIQKPLRPLDMLQTIRQLLEHEQNLKTDITVNMGCQRRLDAADAQFMHTLIDVIVTNYMRVNFGIEDLTVEMQMSRTDIAHRLMDLTGCTLGEYIKLWRLNEARKLMAMGGISVSQTAHSVGAADVAHFTRSYAWRYGQSALGNRPL